ncbi:GIY-YIG nuclease family protein [Leptolyngbya sp. AN02str]|uniref:GIY-YIG nuclease family protein n=1 Tax=Leptolyngbya sp. AN02str TaxID=3423363 RepID=UPI003D31E577
MMHGVHLFPDLCLDRLPSVSLKQRDQLPASPGIYFAINAKGQVLYIGLARNLASRWQGQNHHRLDQLLRINQRSPVQLAWLDCRQSTHTLSVLEAHYIKTFHPLLNGTQVPARKITPAETVLQATLTKISKYTVVFGIAPESELREIPTVNLRYFGWGRDVSTLRRIFKASNQKASGLKWTEVKRRKWGAWWRTQCNGIAIELGPWTESPDIVQTIRSEATGRSLAGVGILALQPKQLEMMVEKAPYLIDNYPGIQVLIHDPIRLLWSPSSGQDHRFDNSTSNAASQLDFESQISSLSVPHSGSLQATDATMTDLTIQPNLDSEQHGKKPSSAIPKSMNRAFFHVDGVEIEVCWDENNRPFVRHHLVWKICEMGRDKGLALTDRERESVVSNLQLIANRRLETIRWVGYQFQFEPVAFDEEIETEAVLVPLAMFEDIIKYTTVHPDPESNVRKLEHWLQNNSLFSLIEQRCEL